MIPGSFSPATIAITQGDSIEFFNADPREDHWPASNIHPTHEIYSAFDPKRPIPAGEKWVFQFDRAGSWRMHDHLFPEVTGTVTVGADDDTEHRETPAFENPEAWTTTPPKSGFFHRLKVSLLRVLYNVLPSLRESALARISILQLTNDESALQTLIEIVGPEHVMEDLLRDSGGGSVIDCHQEAHKIGRISYKLFGTSVFAASDFSCHSGFPHGAMEALLQERGTEHLAETFADICGKFSTGYTKFECLHGIGHGVLAYVDYDLPTALTLCRKLPSDYDRTSCYGGAFMENIITAQGRGARSAHATKWVSQDPLFPCSGIEKSQAVQYQCYQMQTSWMLTLFKDDFAQVAAACMRAPAEMVAVCFKSYGRDAAGMTLRSIPKILPLCDQVRGLHPEAYSACIQGALNVIVDFWGPKLTGQAIEFCAAVSESEKQACYTTLGNRFRDLFPEEKEWQSRCREIEKEYQGVCSGTS